MLIKNLTYENPFTEDEVTVEWYFHVSQADIAEMAISSDQPDFADNLRKLQTERDGKEIIRLMKEILRMSVGKKSADGNQFVRNDTLRDEFFQGGAYEALFVEFLSDTAKIVEFVKGIAPKAIREQVGKEVEKFESQMATLTEGVDLATPQSPPPPVEEKAPETNEDDRPSWVKEGRIPNAEELKGAKPEHIQLAFAMREGRVGN